MVTAMPRPASQPGPSGTGSPRPLSSAAWTRSRHSSTPQLPIWTSSGCSLKDSSGSPGCTTLRRRMTAGSSPSIRASSSRPDSTANADWDSPYPRNAPAGTVFVYTDQPSTRLFGHRYRLIASLLLWNSTPPLWLP